MARRLAGAAGRGSLDPDPVTAANLPAEAVAVHTADLAPMAPALDSRRAAPIAIAMMRRPVPALSVVLGPVDRRAVRQGHLRRFLRLRGLRIAGAAGAGPDRECNQNDRRSMKTSFFAPNIQILSEKSN